MMVQLEKHISVYIITIKLQLQLHLQLHLQLQPNSSPAPALGGAPSGHADAMRKLCGTEPLEPATTAAAVDLVAEARARAQQSDMTVT